MVLTATTPTRTREITVHEADAHDLFLRALDLPIEHREAFLAEECPSPEVREEVEALLRALDEAEGFLDGSGGGAALEQVGTLIAGRYRLEVSSPGIDRPLVRLEDFEHYKGFEAKLETMTPAENGQKRYRGVIKGLQDNRVLVETDTGQVEIAFSDLAKAKLVLTDELIKAAAS